MAQVISPPKNLKVKNLTKTVALGQANLRIPLLQLMFKREKAKGQKLITTRRWLIEILWE